MAMLDNFSLVCLPLTARSLLIHHTMLVLEPCSHSQLSQEIDLAGPSPTVVNIVEFPRNIGVLRVILVHKIVQMSFFSFALVSRLGDGFTVQVSAGGLGGGLGEGAGVGMGVRGETWAQVVSCTIAGYREGRQSGPVQVVADASTSSRPLAGSDRGRAQGLPSSAAATWSRLQSQ